MKLGLAVLHVRTRPVFKASTGVWGTKPHRVQTQSREEKAIAHVQAVLGGAAGGNGGLVGSCSEF